MGNNLKTVSWFYKKLQLKNGVEENLQNFIPFETEWVTGFNQFLENIIYIL